MSILEAPISVLSKYADFTGRASRSEFWWWWLIMLLIQFGFTGGLNYTISTTLGIIYIALIIPTFAVIARRLHDLDTNGWWAVLGLIPIGMFIILVWCIKKGTDGPNQYGPDPLEPVGPIVPPEG